MLNGFNHVYVNQLYTGFAYQNGRFFNTAGLTHSYVGRRVYIGDNEFLIVGQTGTELQLVANVVLRGEVTSQGDVVTQSTKVSMMETAQAWISQQLKVLGSNTSNIELTYNFAPFNTYNNALTFKTAKEIFIEDANMKLYNVVHDDGLGTTRSAQKPEAGDEIVFRPYVRLALSEWLVNPNGTISWSPSLNTNIVSIELNNIIDRMQDTMIPSSSSNRHMVHDMKNALIDIGGGAEVYIDNDGTPILRLPYNPAFFDKNGKPDKKAIEAHLDLYGLSTTVTATGDTYPISTYLQIGGLAGYDKTSLRYTKPTMVSINNNPYVIGTNGMVSEWTPVSWLEFVDFRLERWENFSVVAIAVDAMNQIHARVDSFQKQRPLRPAIGVRSYSFGIGSLSITHTMDIGQMHYEGVAHANEFFEQIRLNFTLMRTHSILSLIVWSALMLSMFFALMILITRVAYQAPWTRNLVAAFHSNTSIDLFAVASLGIVHVEGEPKNWIEILVYVVGVGVVPTTIVALFQLFGFNVL